MQVGDGQAPTLQSVSLTSDKPGSTVTAGDTVSLTFTASEKITGVEVTINGNVSVSTNTEGNTWSAARTVDSTDAAGAVTFAISFVDAVGNAGVQVTATTDDSAIRVQVPASVRGTVFADTDGDGVQDAGERGISGYGMIMHDYSMGLTSRAVTSPDGTYAFEDLTPRDTYLVQTGFYPLGHTLSSGKWFDYITPQDGQKVSFDVGFYPVPATKMAMATVDIVVYSDENLNGARDAGEAGVGGLDDFYLYTYVYGPTDGAILLTGSNATDDDGRITMQVAPADFGVFVNIVYLADAGYVWYTTDYQRDDGVAAGNLYDSTLPIIRSPGPGSTHTVTIGLVPAS